MGTRDKERYFWLKLPKDFFTGHDMRVLESLPNGKEYVLIYLKLMLEAVDHEGALRFSETIPYNDEMIAAVTNSNIDVVRVAVKVLEQFGLIEVLDDQTLFLGRVAELLGSETYAAKRKRSQRTEGLIGGHCPPAVPRLSPECPQEIDIEIDKDTEIDREKKIHKRKEKPFVPPTLEEVTAYCYGRHSTVNPQEFYEYFSTGHWIDSEGKPVKNWKQKIITWEHLNKRKPQKRDTGNIFLQMLEDET